MKYLTILSLICFFSSNSSLNFKKIECKNETSIDFVYDFLEIRLNLPTKQKSNLFEVKFDYEIPEMLKNSIIKAFFNESTIQEQKFLIPNLEMQLDLFGQLANCELLHEKNAENFAMLGLSGMFTSDMNQQNEEYVLQYGEFRKYQLSPSEFLFEYSFCPFAIKLIYNIETNKTSFEENFPLELFADSTLLLETLISHINQKCEYRIIKRSINAFFEKYKTKKLQAKTEDLQPLQPTQMPYLDIFTSEILIEEVNIILHLQGQVNEILEIERLDETCIAVFEIWNAYNNQNETYRITFSHPGIAFNTFENSTFFAISPKVYISEELMKEICEFLYTSKELQFYRELPENEQPSILSFLKIISEHEIYASRFWNFSHHTSFVDNEFTSYAQYMIVDNIGNKQEFKELQIALANSVEKNEVEDYIQNTLHARLKATRDFHESWTFEFSHNCPYSIAEILFTTLKRSFLDIDSFNSASEERKITRSFKNAAKQFFQYLSRKENFQDDNIEVINTFDQRNSMKSLVKVKTNFR